MVARTNIFDYGLELLVTGSTHTPAENDHFEGNFVPRNFFPNLWPHVTLRLSFSALAGEDITQNTTRLDTLSNCHPLPTGPSGVTTTTTLHPPHRITLLWMLRNVTRVLALVPLRSLHSSVRNSLSHYPSLALFTASLPFLDREYVFLGHKLASHSLPPVKAQIDDNGTQKTRNGQASGGA